MQVRGSALSQATAYRAVRPGTAPACLRFGESIPGASYGHLPYPVSPKSAMVQAVPGNEKSWLKPDAAQALQNMMAAARQDGVIIKPVSAYRDYDYQVRLFHDVARQRGITLAERARVCAPPGFSEHHTGYATDLADDTPGATLEEQFANTRAFAWLKKNAHRFGFELSFPRHNIQGVMYEPWHWRYVGNAESRRLFAEAQRLNSKLA